MKYREQAQGNRTWHSAVVNGAHDRYCSKSDTEALDTLVKRRIWSVPVAHTYWRIESTSANELSNTASSILSPDYGEIVPGPYFITVDHRKNSTVLENPESLGRPRSTIDRFKNEVLAWHSRMNARHISGLMKRLDYLFEDEPESSGSQELPDINSFGMLLAFLARHHEVKTPSLGYNRDGVFSATWVGDQKLRVTLDFMSSSSVRWIFVDSREGLKKAITGAGIVPIDDILTDVLKVYGALDLMKS